MVIPLALVLYYYAIQSPKTRMILYIKKRFVNAFEPFYHYPIIPLVTCFFLGSMLSAVLLVLGCLLQRTVVTTEGHRGTNRHVFYALRMDGGIRAARALAVQHGLEFIRRVSGSLKPLLLPPPMGLQFAFSKSGY